MGLFTKKENEDELTEKNVIAMAETLIINQLNGSTSYSFYGGMHDRGAYKPAAASKYAETILNKAIRSVDIKEKIDVFLQGEVLENIIAKHIQKEVRQIVREELIEEIVTKINSVQVRKQQ